jgi:hypothetical protein
MLSLTRNTPPAAFTDPERFSGGVGVGVYSSEHKAHPFSGISRQETRLPANRKKSTSQASFAGPYPFVDSENPGES